MLSTIYYDTAFIKSALPRTPTRKNFDWWGGRA